MLVMPWFYQRETNTIAAITPIGKIITLKAIPYITIHSILPAFTVKSRFSSSWIVVGADFLEKH
jgi:hypothetical protein